MKAGGPVSLIEAAYTADAAESDWLGRVAEAGAAYDLGRGLVAWTVDLADTPTVRCITARGDAESFIAPIRGFVSGLSRSSAHAMFAPTEFVGNASWRINRLAEAAHTPSAFRPPLWVLIGGDGLTAAVALAFQADADELAPDVAFPHEDRRVLGLVAAHLGSALRLRTALPTASNDLAEAVLDPEGRVLHAEGAAKSPEARTSLTEAVLRAERARGGLRRTDAAGAAELWQALVDGRWSIIESVERDGKRLLLARANAPTSPDRAALDANESDVVWLAAFGHTYKYISYELGITVSTLVRRLQSAMLKLGVATRHELLRKLGR